MKRAGYISDHDALIGEKLARILTGGDLNHATRVSEQYLLDLEREAFLSLIGTRKTQERMAHMLKTGKPLQELGRVSRLCRLMCGKATPFRPDASRDGRLRLPKWRGAASQNFTINSGKA